jgi:hypothetical protein
MWKKFIGSGKMFRPCFVEALEWVRTCFIPAKSDTPKNTAQLFCRRESDGHNPENASKTPRVEADQHTP